MKRSRERASYALEILRLLAIGAVGIAFLALWASTMTGCAGLPGASSSSPAAVEPIEKLDLQVNINGQDFPGWGVAPLATKYIVTITPAERIGRIQWRTCDRSDEIDRGSQGFFGDLFGSRDTTFSFTYSPDPNLEQKHHCPLEIDVLTSKKQFDGFAVIDFGDRRPEYVVAARMTCNGEAVKRTGVGMCQSRVDLMQSISFDQPVIAKGISPECDVMKDLDGKAMNFQFAIAPGKCLYTFVAEAKATNGERQAFRLFTHGYNDVPVRE